MGLNECAKEANERGMSYGTYMLERAKQQSVINVGGLRCLECGELLEGRRIMYCSKRCRNKRELKRRLGGNFV